MSEGVEIEKTIYRKFTFRDKNFALYVRVENGRIEGVNVHGNPDGIIGLMNFVLNNQDRFNEFIDIIRKEIASDIAERVLEEATKGGK